MVTRRTNQSARARVDALIVSIRGSRVLLDSDLAYLYGVSTKRLNEQVKRNRRRFPSDFCFRLKLSEVEAARAHMRSQIATGSRRNVRYRPYAFTEHGAVMAANVLNSRRALEMSVFVVRSFVRMRVVLESSGDLAARVKELEEKITRRLDTHERGIVYVLEELRKLRTPPALPEPRRRPIGFDR